MRARRPGGEGSAPPLSRRGEARAFGRRVLDLGLAFGAARRRAWSGAGVAELERRFDRPIPERGRPAAQVLRHLERDIAAHSMPMAHPRLFGLFTPAPLPIAAFAELAAAFLNQSPDAWKAGPAATEIEKRLVRLFTESIGWRRGAFGVFTSGGGMANLMALKMARDRALGIGVRRRGLGRRATRLRVYASDQAHFSIGRALDLLGLGDRTLVRIATGTDRRLAPERLEAAMRRDRRRGLVPMAVVATAGTTNTGTLDPLAAIAEACGRAGVFLHVDAAYGGALLLSTGHRARLAGIEQADTVTVDPHKWLFQPFSLGGLFARDRAALHAAFVTEPDYLRKDLEAERDRLDFYQYSIEGSRPFRGLKLWLTLQLHGRAGLGALVDRTMAVAAHLERQVAADPAFEASGAAADLASLCFRYRPRWSRRPGRGGGAADRRRLDAAQRALQQEVERRGFAWFPTVRMGNAVWLRFGVFNHRTTPRDVDDVLAHLKRVAADLGIG
ncbi:MAG TPA: pyridoxal-dependent decarboxylase [Dongiaceae bacterium]|nr:pyridoxal-dependent decarboxylase [Dongiaceae bacterium]